MKASMRLDQALVSRSLVPTRSQADSYIRLGYVVVNGRVATKAAMPIRADDRVEVTAEERYVSRAGHKLASVADGLGVDFRNKIVLDVGSSTGGFTDYALQHGARKVIAVDVGTDQMHSKLRRDARVELHEKTDIRDFVTSDRIDIVVADVSFISLRAILPSVLTFCTPVTDIIAMVKPQFESGASGQLKHKGVIKNDHMRRDILKDFEDWARRTFIVLNKADSSVPGSRGNLERFYLLRIPQL